MREFLSRSHFIFHFKSHILTSSIMKKLFNLSKPGNWTFGNTSLMRLHFGSVLHLLRFDWNHTKSCCLYTNWPYLFLSVKNTGPHIAAHHRHKKCILPPFCQRRCTPPYSSIGWVLCNMVLVTVLIQEHLHFGPASASSRWCFHELLPWFYRFVKTSLVPLRVLLEVQLHMTTDYSQ